MRVSSTEYSSSSFPKYSSILPYTRGEITGEWLWTHFVLHKSWNHNIFRPAWCEDLDAQPVPPFALHLCSEMSPKKDVEHLEIHFLFRSFFGDIMIVDSVLDPFLWFLSFLATSALLRWSNENLKDENPWKKVENTSAQRAPGKIQAMIVMTSFRFKLYYKFGCSPPTCIGYIHTQFFIKHSTIFDPSTPSSCEYASLNWTIAGQKPQRPAVGIA